jgi:hypothetical protein
MSSIAKYFFVLWLLLFVITTISYLSKLEIRLPIVGLSILLLIVVFAIVRERLRRRREGYYIYRRGGAEGGTLFYEEEGKSLEFYFDRTNNTIYIPSDLKWKESMPSWARERKNEIITRIKTRIGKRWIGKSWTYAESDSIEHLINQK